MKKFSQLLLLFTANSLTFSAFAACDCGSSDQNQPCSGNSINVTVNGARSLVFNWSFQSGQQAALCGQFANGDYWIAPADGENSVTLTAVTGSGSGPLSLDENPKPESIGLLDSINTYGNYVAEENILNALPLNFSQNTSLVAAIQKDEATHGNCGTRAIEGNCVEAYHVVTLLDQVPANAGVTVLRPSIDEPVKELLDLSAFDFNRLPSLPYIDSIDSAEMESIRQRWSHSTEIFSIKATNGEVYSEGGRAFRADSLVDDYASGVARTFYQNVLSLMASGNDEAEKRQALAAILTYGKDLYYGVYDHDVRTRGWSSGAGQHLGKFPPTVLFAALYEDDFYANVLRQTSLTMLGLRDGNSPQELEQINVGINGPIWGDFPDEMGRYEVTRYWSEMLGGQCFDGATGECRSSIGKKTTRDPYGFIDGPPAKPGSSYMAVSAGPIRGFAALSHLIPEVCSIINYPLLTEYTDRIGNQGLLTENDNCAPPDPREDPSTCDAYRGRDCEYYGLSNTGTATWGPVSEENLMQCIPNNSNGNSGQNGRYPHYHGDTVSIGYPALLVEGNWQAIRNSPQPCLLNDLIFSNSFENAQ
ncbi:hypothetical protein [Marinicella sp. W31]|uniref:hypothetical protein n=1 Tax=Marinicella sp. W31 TaxID=3023713 RepID=UPI00375700E0